MRRLLLIPIIIGIAIWIFMTNITGIDETLYNVGQYTYQLDSLGNATIVGFVPAEKQSVLAIPFSIDDHIVTSIKSNVFDLEGMMEVHLPEGLIDLEENAFINCDEVVDFTVNCELKSDNGFLGLNNIKNMVITKSLKSDRLNDYDQLQSGLIYKDSLSSIERVMIADEISYIGDYCLANMDSLKDIEISSNVKEIGNHSFLNDVNLKRVNLPDRLEKIGGNCFDGISGATFIINSSLNDIQKDSFNKENTFYVHNNEKMSMKLTDLGISNKALELKCENDSYSVNQGQKVTIKLLDDFNEKIHFYSSDTDVALVNSTGTILGVKAGEAIIEIKSSLVSTSVKVVVNQGDSDSFIMKVDERIPIDLNQFGIHSDDEYYFESSNDDAVIVTDKNEIVALENGKSTIQLIHGEDKHIFNVDVISLVSDIEIEQETLTVNNGGYLNVNAKVSPSNAYNNQLVYSIEDESIAKVDCNGRIVGKKTGTTNLMIRSTDGSSIEKTVEINVTSAKISLDNAPVVLMPGKHYRLTGTCNDGSKLQYLCIDEQIASIDEKGIVTAKKEGLTDIIVYNANKTAFKKIKCIVYDAVSYGIDLSEWNGYYYTKDNFVKVKKDGIDFVYLRAAYEDDYEDPVFQRNYSAAKAAGLDVGAYHYITATTVEKAKSEAYWMLSILKGKKFEYPVMLDIESSKHKALSVYQWNVVVDTYCNIIKNAGYDVIVYSYASQLKRLNQPWDAHVANWGVTKPYFDYDYTIWQFTSDGKVSGLSGRVDMNICFKDYPAYIKENHLNGY